MKIRVIRDDIRKGKRKSLCECPVARALKRQTPFSKITVCSALTFIQSNGGSVVVDAPKAVSDFITKFDLGEPVKPFTFELVIK